MEVIVAMEECVTFNGWPVRETVKTHSTDDWQKCFPPEVHRVQGLNFIAPRSKCSLGESISDPYLKIFARRRM